MSKLYPPHLEGTIPAFCEERDGTVNLTVPFSMNRAVSKRQVSGFYLKIKAIQSDKYLATLFSSKFNLNKQEVTFDLSSIKEKINIGQYYKLQIAYVSSDGEVGYYSTAGIVKFTSRPYISIQGLDKNLINQHNYSYVGKYSQQAIRENELRDYTEKEYQYKFIILDNQDQIIYDTGYLIHNNSEDINTYESYDSFTYSPELPMNKNYYLQYKVITNNNLEISSPRYKIAQKKSIKPDIDTKPIPELNFENGYVQIKLDYSNLVKNEQESAVNGYFVLSRKTLEAFEWEDIFKFALAGQRLSEWSWKDFTVEQGKTYIYSLQEYNDYNIFSERIISEPVKVDFEDAFLFDGKRQLKIKYNPKINSFKTDVLEAKIDTIGSKYPFIFRNGNVSYKEFPISGLISYLMDEDHLFIEDNELRLSENFKREDNQDNTMDLNVRTTQLVGYNISAERDFKLAVLDWLTDGAPKLFRSPGEGNYVVRLMNTSLSPEDGLGRMLHTFSCTAYEVADCHYNSLKDFGFISVDRPNLIQTRWETVTLREKASNKEGQNIELIPGGRVANSVRFYDMRPGDIVYINGKSIAIGATGSYFYEYGEDIYSVTIPSGIMYQGLMTYSFNDDSANTFDSIISVKNVEVSATQFIGFHKNILEEIEDIKNNVSNFYYLNFRKRDIIQAYARQDRVEISNGKIVLYRDPLFNSKINELPEENYPNIFEDPFAIYKYHLDKIEIFYRGVKRNIFNYKKIGYLKEEDFLLPLEELRNKFFIQNKNGTYSEITQYKPNQIYYIKEPFELYYDSFQPTESFMSKEMREQFFEMAFDQYQISKKEIENFYKEFSFTIKINEEEIDLEDTYDFIINDFINFDFIGVGAGVILECGYAIQEVEYKEEAELVNYQYMQSIKAILNSRVEDKDTIDFKNKVESLNISSSNYNEIIEEAWRLYRNAYPLYLINLEKLRKGE